MKKQPLSPGQFWDAMGMRATGVAIITTTGAKGHAGFLGLSASHYSAAPPVMTAAVSTRTSALNTILESGIFAINYLSDEGIGIYERFSSRDAPKGSARFDGIDVNRLATGAPVFEPITGAIDCEVLEVVDRLDTALVFGTAVDYRRFPKRHPLVHFDGGIDRIGR